MANFGEYFDQSRVPQWADEYIDLLAIRAFIIAAGQQAPLQDDALRVFAQSEADEFGAVFADLDRLSARVQIGCDIWFGQASDDGLQLDRLPAAEPPIDGRQRPFNRADVGVHFYPRRVTIAEPAVVATCVPTIIRGKTLAEQLQGRMDSFVGEPLSELLINGASETIVGDGEWTVTSNNAEFVAAVVLPLLKRLHTVYASFSRVMSVQLRRVSLFYKKQTAALCSAMLGCVNSSMLGERLTARARRNVKLTFEDCNAALRHVQQFRASNATAIFKILDFVERWWKHDAIAPCDAAVRRLNFISDSNIRTPMLERLATLFVDTVQQRLGDSDVGDTETVSGWTRQHQQHRSQLAGLCGVAAALGAATVAEFSVLPQPLILYNADLAWWHFTVPACFIGMAACFAGSTMLWKAYGVNYVFLFELSLRSHWDGVELMRDIMLYVVVWIGCAYCFVRAAAAEAEKPNAGTEAASVGAWIWVYIMWGLLAVVWVVKQVLHPADRPRWFLRTVARLCATPFFEVAFSDFIMGVLVISLTNPVNELQFFWCTWQIGGATARACLNYRAMGIMALGFVPPLWRAMQCVRNYLKPPPDARTFFPHGVNAIKYVVGMIVQAASFARSLTSFYHKGNASAQEAALAIWFTVAIINTIYRSVWDTMVNFGLSPMSHSEDLGARRQRLRRLFEDGNVAEPAPAQSDEFWPLRKLLFPRWCYPVAVVVNIALRLLWLPVYFIRLGPMKSAQWLPAVTMGAAVFRRFIALSLRVEVEQVRNIESYKMSQEAPPPPADHTLRGSTAEHFATMWDEANGLLAFDAPATAPDTAPVDLLRLTTTSEVDRFFALLPTAEKMSVLNHIGAVFPTPTFSGAHLEGKSQWFAERTEELKAYGIISRLVERGQTLAQYANATVTASRKASAAARMTAPPK